RHDERHQDLDQSKSSRRGTESQRGLRPLIFKKIGSAPLRFCGYLLHGVETFSRVMRLVAPTTLMETRSPRSFAIVIVASVVVPSGRNSRTLRVGWSVSS